MKKKILNKKFICIIAGLLAVAMAIFALYGYRRREQRNQKGILLSFDDYSPDSWSDAFELLDEYGAKVTFFVTLSEPTDFCAEAVRRGHEIGFHTVQHVKMTEMSDSEVYEQAIAPIKTFREQGYELSTFAYPYGLYNEELNVELLQYYDTLRGAYNYVGRYKEDLHNGFIESYSLDNVHFESDEAFHQQISEMLDSLNNCNDGTIAAMYSHAIGGGDWCITAERLEILLQEAQKRNLAFYTFKELQ
nr:polysaccharide deacetylase family protein [Lachnospiraceae bacterium]